MADKNVSIDISAADKTKAAFESVKKGLNEIGGSVEKVKGVFSGFAAIAATVGITDLLKEAVAAASVAEQSSNRLNAVMKATGDTSGYTREQLDKMADSLAKATTFDDEGIRAAQSNLMKFGKLHGETFARAMQVTADYAAFTGKSMLEASQDVGRAIADHEHGLKALGAEFGSLTQKQKDAIEKFDSMGQVAKSNEIIFSKLEQSIGGTAAAMNTGIFGATSAATKAWDDFLKAIGKTGPVQITTTGALHLITEGLDLVTEAINKQNKALKDNPLYNGGQLKPLPTAGDSDGLKALQGAQLTVNDVKNLPPGLRPSIVPGDQNNMTTDEARARGAAAAKAADEARETALAAHKKLMKELIPIADELSHAYAAADSKQKEAAQDMLASYFEEQIKQRQAFETMSDEIGKATMAADDAQRQAAAELQFAWQQEQNQRLGILNEQEKEDRLLSIMDELRSARDIEDQDWIQKQQILQARAAKDFANHDFWAKKMLQVDKQHANNVLIIEAQKNAMVQTMQFQTAQMGIDLLSLVVGKSKAGAIAVIALQKGLAIAQTIAATSAAVMRCFSDLGPIAGVPAAAAIEALGSVQIGLIAATGLVEGARVASGGTDVAIPTFDANPNTGLPDSSSGFASTSSGFDQVTPLQAQQKVQNVINLNVQFVGSGRYTQSEIIDSLGPAFNEALGDGFKLNIKAA